MSCFNTDVRNINLLQELIKNASWNKIFANPEIIAPLLEIFRIYRTENKGIEDVRIFISSSLNDNATEPGDENNKYFCSYFLLAVASLQLLIQQNFTGPVVTFTQQKIQHNGDTPSITTDHTQFIRCLEPYFDSVDIESTDYSINQISSQRYHNSISSNKCLFSSYSYDMIFEKSLNDLMVDGEVIVNIIVAPIALVLSEVILECLYLYVGLSCNEMKNETNYMKRKDNTHSCIIEEMYPSRECVSLWYSRLWFVHQRLLVEASCFGSSHSSTCRRKSLIPLILLLSSHSLIDDDLVETVNRKLFPNDKLESIDYIDSIELFDNQLKVEEEEKTFNLDKSDFISIDLSKREGVIKGDNNNLSDNRRNSVIDNNNNNKCLLLCELSNYLLFYRFPVSILEYTLRRAGYLINSFEWKETGVKGIRRKHQTNQIAQLVCLTRGGECHESCIPNKYSLIEESIEKIEVSSIDYRDIETSEQNVNHVIFEFNGNHEIKDHLPEEQKSIKNFTLNEVYGVDDLYEHVVCSDTDSPIVYPLLSAAKVVLLAYASLLRFSFSSDETDTLGRERINCFVERILAPVSCIEQELQSNKKEKEKEKENYLILAMTLWIRSEVDFSSYKTKDRALLQLNELVRCHIINDNKNRSTYFHSLLYPSLPDLLKEVGRRMMRNGMVLSAFDHLTRAELHEEAADCLMAAGRKNQANEFIRNRIKEKKEKGKSCWRELCQLGECTQDPSYWLDAWKDSKDTYARAARTLGRYSASITEENEYLNNIYEGLVNVSEFNFNEEKQGVLSKYWDMAVYFIRKSLAISPLHYDIRLLLGSLYMKRMKWDLAIESLTAAVNIEDDQAEAWANLSTCYLQLHRLSEEESELEEDNNLLPVLPNIRQLKENVQSKEESILWVNSIPMNINSNIPTTDKDLYELSMNMKISLKCIMTATRFDRQNWKIWSNLLSISQLSNSWSTLCMAIRTLTLELEQDHFLLRDPTVWKSLLLASTSNPSNCRLVLNLLVDIAMVKSTEPIVWMLLAECTDAQSGMMDSNSNEKNEEECNKKNKNKNKEEKNKNKNKNNNSLPPSTSNTEVSKYRFCQLRNLLPKIMDCIDKNELLNYLRMVQNCLDSIAKNAPYMFLRSVIFNDKSINIYSRNIPEIQISPPEVLMVMRSLERKIRIKISVNNIDIVDIHSSPFGLLCDNIFKRIIDIEKMIPLDTIEE